MIIVDIFGQIKNKKRVREFVESSLYYLLPELKEQIHIDVTFKKTLDGNVFGYCSGDKNSAEIEIAKTSGGVPLLQDEIMLSLAHEIIHAKQFITGELSPSSMRWKKADYTKVPYSHQPWEREAYRWETRLYEKYFKKLGA